MDRPRGAKCFRAAGWILAGRVELGMTLRRGERATPEDAFIDTPFKTAVPNAGRPYPGVRTPVNRKIQDVGPQAGYDPI